VALTDLTLNVTLVEILSLSSFPMTG